MAGYVPLIKIKAVKRDPLQSSTDLIVAGYSYKSTPLTGYIGRLDWFLNGQISYLIKAAKITGSLGETVLLSSLNKIPPEKILIVGLGPRENLTPVIIQQCCSNIFGAIAGLGLKSVSIGVFEKTAKELEYNEMVHNMIGGILTGYMKNFPNDETLSVNFAEENKAKYDILFKAVKFAIEHYPGGYDQD